MFLKLLLLLSNQQFSVILTYYSNIIIMNSVLNKIINLSITFIDWFS